MAGVGRRRLLVLMGISVLIVINLYLALRESDPDENQEVKDSLIRQGYLQAWHSQPGASLAAPDLKDALTRLPVDDCLAISTDDRIKVAELDIAAREGLYRTLLEFLECYASNNKDGTEQLLAFMKRREEVVPIETIKLMNGLLVKDAGMQKADLAGKSPEELVGIFHNKLNAKHPFQEILIEGSCLSALKSDRAPPEGLARATTREDHKLWRNQVGFTHLFKPRWSLDQEVGSKGTVILAEARLLIRHDSSNFQIVCPYYLRLWYDSRGRCWHPLSLECYPTSEDFHVRFLF